MYRMVLVELRRCSSCGARWNCRDERSRVRRVKCPNCGQRSAPGLDTVETRWRRVQILGALGIRG